MDAETGVASEGKTREKALRNLDEAVTVALEAGAAGGGAPEPGAPWFDA